MKYKAIQRLLFVTSLVFVAACGSYEPYTEKDMHLPDKFLIPDSVGQKLDTMMIPRDHFFKDSVLVRLIDSAFKNNFDLRTANKEIDINEAFYKQSKAAFYPKINMNLFSIERRWYSRNYRGSANSKWYDEHKHEDPPRDMYLDRAEQISSVALDWEVDIWGKIRKQKEAAAALYQQSHVARRALQTELIATIAEKYYNLISLDEQLEVAKENHNFRDSTLTMIKLLYNSGEVSALAVQQSQTQVLEASSLISRIEEQRSIQENNLRLLTGELPGDIGRNLTLKVEDSTYEEVKEIPLYTVQNRPDILIAQYGLVAANAKAGVAQRMRYPSLNISASGGVNSMLAKNWFNVPGSLFGQILGGITAPIFNGRKLKTNYEVALLERDEAEINFQRNVYQAIVEVENIQISLKRLEDQLDIARVQEMVAQKALENSRMLFRSGFADYLEVITAQSAALEAELDLVRIKSDLLTMRIQLYRALGGGWE